MRRTSTSGTERRPREETPPRAESHACYWGVTVTHRMSGTSTEHCTCRTWQKCALWNVLEIYPQRFWGQHFLGCVLLGTLRSHLLFTSLVLEKLAQ